MGGVRLIIENTFLFSMTVQNEMTVINREEHFQRHHLLLIRLLMYPPLWHATFNCMADLEL